MTEELSEWVRDGKTGVKIVDVRSTGGMCHAYVHVYLICVFAAIGYMQVRDEDFVDGHIPGALNHPSEVCRAVTGTLWSTKHRRMSGYVLT